MRISVRRHYYEEYKSNRDDCQPAPNQCGVQVYHAITLLPEARSSPALCELPHIGAGLHAIMIEVRGNRYE